jgi:1-acyl-sn-glycerol-3-phosphate acyltransferase
MLGRHRTAPDTIDEMPATNETLQPEEHAPQPVLSFALRWANYLFFVPMIGAVTIFFGTVSLVVGIWDKDGSQQHAVANLWARVLLCLSLSPVTLEHAERLPATPNAVYASNHLSYYDTPVLFAKLPFQFRILAKAPLWKIPFIGWYLDRSGQVPIDQSSVRAGVVSLARGAKTLAGGMPMVIFPEGGRAYNGELQPMLAGAAWMAIKAQVPLVPLTLIGTYELLPIHVYALRPRPLKLIVGEPIPTTGMKTSEAEALTERLRAVIHETYIAESAN